MQEIKFDQPQYERFRLPSNGCGHGVVELDIRPMTMKEEKFLTNKTLMKQGTVHNEIFKSVIGAAYDAKGDQCSLKISQLFTEDELALLLFVRAISYGVDYETEIVCQECKKKYPISLNLETDLPITYAEEGLPTIVDVSLPVSKKNVKISYPIKGVADMCDDPVDMLPHLITHVDGIDQSVVPMWMQSLIGRDIAELRKAIEDVPFGVSKLVKFTCTNDKCGLAGVEKEVPLPITAEFFRY